MPITARIMVQRVGYGTLTIAFLIALFEMDAVIAERAQQLASAWGRLLQCGSIVPALFLCAILAGVVELVRLFRAGGVKPHTKLAFVATAIVFLSPWLSAAGWLGNSVRAVEGLYWPLVLIMLTVLAAGGLTLLRGHTDGALRDTSATVFIVFYLGFLGSFALQLRCGTDIPAREGIWLLLITILVTKCSDIGGFFVGSAVGRHRLAPKISPGKSIEGAIGGIAASVLVSLLFASAGTIAARFGAPESVRVITDLFTRSFSLRSGAESLSPTMRAIIFGFTLSVVAQIGDLFESALKRDAGVKDSGRLIPRYGGVLDLIDSPIFALPAAWLLLTGVWNLP